MGQRSSKLFDLPHQLSFYASYHANPVYCCSLRNAHSYILSSNQVIHIVGVPTIVWSALVFFTYAKPLWVLPTVPIEWKSTLSLTYGLALTSAYGMYYTCLDPIAGLGAWALLYGLYNASNSFATKFGPDAWKVALVAHVAGWVSQFIGHGVFEGRRPALFDNLFQSFVLAPFFVFLEVLFKLGYRPALHKQIQNETGKRILAFRSAQQKKN